ncbi:hypothetical protein Tco_1476226 [Tanacetum coccineum]
MFSNSSALCHIKSPKLPLDEVESSFDEILDDLFRIGAKNIRKMEHEVPNRCDHINDYEDCDQENGDLLDLPTFSATNEIASDCEQVEENIDIAEEKEKVPMKDVKMDENHIIDHSAIQVEVCGVMLGRSLATGNHFKSGLVGYHSKDDDGIFMIMDVAQGSRLGAWLRAWTLVLILLSLEYFTMRMTNMILQRRIGTNRKEMKAELAFALDEPTPVVAEPEADSLAIEIIMLSGCRLSGPRTSHSANSRQIRLEDRHTDDQGIKETESGDDVSLLSYLNHDQFMMVHEIYEEIYRRKKMTKIREERECLVDYLTNV